MRIKTMRVVFALVLTAVALIVMITTMAGADGIDRDISEPVVQDKTIELEALSVQYSGETPTVKVMEADEPSEPIEEIWPYPLTQEEIDLIALITMGEAEGESELGKRLVIDTILNRKDDPAFPDTIHDVIYYPNAFSVVDNGRLDRCYVMPEIVELVKEELLERTNYDCVYFCSTGYSKYGTPMFQEDHHYFSSN